MFKTIQNTVKDISNIGNIAYIGTDGLFDNSTVLTYKKHLEGLSHTQAEAALTSAGLTKAQRNQILATTEITSATKALTIGQIEERIATELNSKEDAKAITQKLTKIGIISSESGATTSLTVDILEQAVANGTLTASEASSIASALGLTVANTTLSVSFKVLTTTIWTNIKALLVWLGTNPIGWAILATSALYGLAKVFVENTTSIEEAKEETKKYVDALSSINSEVENLESRLKDLNNQINNLDPITDADDIEKLKLESSELENQLAILKEKQRLASIEADKASQESLNRTQTSRYEFGEGQSFNGLTGETLEYKTAVEVTRIKELQNAMDAYDEYAKKQSELRGELAKMAESGDYTQEEWDNLETSINDLDVKMQETRTHASELASELNEEKAGLNGVDEASRDLLKDTNSVIGKYNEWTDEINSTTNALKENANVKDSMSNIGNKTAVSFTDQISQIQSLSSGLDQLDEIMADITEGGDFDYSSILNDSDFIETFSKYKEEYENFIKAVTNSPDDISKCKSAFDDLATAYIYGSGALADLTEESKDAAILELTQMGIANATEIVNNALGRYSDALNVAKQYSFDLNSQTLESLSGFAQEKDIATEDAEALFYYAMQKTLCSENSLSTAEDCEQLIALAEQAKITGAIIDKLRIALSIMSSGGGAVTWGKKTKELARQEVEKAFSELANIEVDFKNAPKTKSALEKSGKDAAKEYKEALKEELSDLDSVLGFITDTIQEQIDTWNEAKDTAVDALEAQRDAAIEALEVEKELVQSKIDAKQKEIDKIKEAREQRNAEIDLMRKQFDLERLQTQRTRLVYKNGQMVYETDSEGIRDARNAVTEVKEDIKILKKEKEISKLEETMDSLDRQIDSINDQYDKLISQTETYYDNLVKGFEEYKSRWEEVGKIEEQAKIKNALENIGITTTDVLNMSGDAFNQFKQSYLGILTEMYNGESEMVSAINSVANDINIDNLSVGLNKTKEHIDTLINTDYSTLVNGASEISSAFNGAYDSVSNVANAINGASSDSSSETTDNSSTNSLMSAIQSGVEFATSDAGVSAITNRFLDLNSTLDATFDKLSLVESKIMSISNFESTNVLPTLNAYASGTTHAKKGLAVVGEQPELIKDTKGNLSLATKPTLLNMEGGEKVYNGKETANLLNGNGLHEAWIEYTTKYADNPALLTTEIMQQYPKLYQASQDIWARQVDYLTGKDKATPMVENKSNSYNVGDIHIHCSGITSQQVAEQTARELDKQIFGMQGYFRQKASITR